MRCLGPNPRSGVLWARPSVHSGPVGGPDSTGVMHALLRGALWVTLPHIHMHVHLYSAQHARVACRCQIVTYSGARRGAGLAAASLARHTPAPQNTYTRTHKPLQVVTVTHAYARAHKACVSATPRRLGINRTGQ